MTFTKSFLTLTLVISLASVSFAADKVNPSPDAQAIDSACTQEATTASCGTEKVGTGLLKCIHAFKKANPTFKLSPGCKAAMKQMHQHRQEKKAE